MEPPDVHAEHILAALRLHGLEHIALAAEALADFETAKRLEELARRLPISGDDWRESAKAYRRRAELKSKQQKVVR